MALSFEFLEVMYFIPTLFGMGGGILVGLYIYGLLGGLIGILLYKRKILKLPNYKISAFAGYLIFIFFLFILPALLTASFSGAAFTLSSLSLFHIIVILIFLTLFEKKKVIKSLYWSFVLSYLLACFAFSIFGLSYLSWGISGSVIP